jgi:exosortase
MSTTAAAALGKPRTTTPDASASMTPLWTMLAVLGLAHLPLLISHGQSLWKREHYQLFPLVLIFAGILAKPAWEAARIAPAGPSMRKLAFWLLGLNWLMLAFAVIVDSPVLGAMSFWVLLVATAIATGGWPTLRAAIPALAYLLLIIPPPFNLDVRLVTFLQHYTSEAANRVLDLMGIYHAINGVVIEVGDKRYEIEHACSGISSLLSVLACTLFYVFWVKAHWLRGILLVLASVFWVLVNNAVRVIVIVLVDTKLGIDLSNDDPPFFKHTMLGIVLFALTLALIASTDRLLMFLGSTIQWGEPKNRVSAPLRPTGAAPFSVGWNAVAMIAVAYGILVLFQAGDYGIGDSVPESRLIASYNEFSKDTIPSEFSGWKLSPGASAFTTRKSKDIYDNYGENSRTWRYQKGNLFAVVSFDYPFPYWHDLRMCYEAEGWQIADNEMYMQPVADKSDTIESMFVHFTRPVERNGYLWFGEFDLNGRPVDAKVPTGSAVRFGRRFDSLKSRWNRLIGKDVDPETRAFNVLQVQVFSETHGLMTPAEKKEMQEFFAAVLNHMRSKCLECLRTANANRS